MTHYPDLSITMKFVELDKKLGITPQKTTKAKCEKRVKISNISETNVSCPDCRSVLQHEINTYEHMTSDLDSEFKNTIHNYLDCLKSVLSS